MALNIIIGQASCGKSEYICKMLAEQSIAHPEKHFIAIVPEQATLLMQKRLMAVHPRQVITNIDIVSFEFLAHMVFAELGKNTSHVLDDTGKALILRKLLNEIRDDLLVYGKKIRMPGFVEEIKSIITEFKQYDVDDNTLFLMQETVAEQGSRLLFSKLQDIRLIYRKFDEAISEKYTTAEEILDLFANCVHSSQLIRDAEIFLDGFTGFTPVQYKLLEQMLKAAANITMTLTLPEEKICADCPDYDLFYLSNRTYFKMQELAEHSGQKLETVVCLPDKDRIENKNKVARIFSARTLTEEVTFAAAKILELVRKEGFRFRDIAIVVSDMETYYRTIKTVFEEAGIAYFIDHKTRLSQNALAHFLLAAIRIIEERFSFHAVFSFLKTGLTDLTSEEIGMIENYCLEFGINGIRAFREEFVKNRMHGEPWDLKEVNRIREKLLRCLDVFYSALSGGKNTAEQYCFAIEKLFETNGVRERLAAMADAFEQEGMLALKEEYEQLFDQVKELLEKIRELLGGEELSPSEYADIVAQGLEEIKVGVVPPSLDAVVAGDLTRTRLGQVKALFVIGANEGKLPKESAGGSRVFTQKERELLKTRDFEIAPTVLENIYTQRFYLYLMLSRPEEYLWITYPQIAFDGSTLLPSYVLSELPELLPGIVTETETEMPEKTWEDEWFMTLAGTITEPEETLLNYFAKERPQRLKQILEGAFFSNRQNALDSQIAQDIYGDQLVGSVSRYEKFAECPFKHFLQYGLRIEKRPEYEIRAADIGTIYHDSLEKYSDKLVEKGLSFRTISDAESHRLVRESVEEAVAAQNSDIMESTARNVFLKKRILKITRKTTDVLRRQVKNGKYEPAFFEHAFFKNLSESVRFTGKIDRVDIYDGDDVFVKIIDYKSGAKKFDVIDICTGVQLQLVAYLNEALQEAEHQYPQKQVQPGGIYYYLIQDKFARSDEEAEKKYMMSGITSCEQEALAAIDTTVSPEEPGNSRIVDIKYTNNGLASNSKVANRTEFQHLLQFVNHKILDISEQIKEGNVDIAPLYKSDSRNACNYCDYKDVCKFEDGNYGTAWNRAAEEMTTEEAERQLFGRERIK